MHVTVRREQPRLAAAVCERGDVQGRRRRVRRAGIERDRRLGGGGEVRPQAHEDHLRAQRAEASDAHDGGEQPRGGAAELGQGGFEDADAEGAGERP